VITVVYKKGKIRLLLRDTDGKNVEDVKDICAEFQLEDTDFFTEDHDTYIFMAA
jgi:hypothetical protein